MIKVSLIVPIYNAEKYLNECIDSLIRQTLKDIEIILINDGSTDNSEKIVKEYTDNRIVYISKANEGIGKTRNKGINLAKGKYIAFIDSDDYIALDFCEKMYNEADNNDCDMVVCDYYNFSSKTNKIFKIDKFKKVKLEDNPSLINTINLGPCNKIYAKELLINNKIKFNEILKYEDAPFVCLALLNAKQIGQVKEPLCYFRAHEGSQTTVRDEKIFDIIKIFENIRDILKSEKFNNYIDKLTVDTILNYVVQTRYIKDKKIRNMFIDMAYAFLEKKVPEYKKYINNYGKIINCVLKHKNLVKIYCGMYKR